MLTNKLRPQRLFNLVGATMAAVGMFAGIAISGPTQAATFTLAELVAGQEFTIGNLRFYDWVFRENDSTVQPTVITIVTIDDTSLPGFRLNTNGEMNNEESLKYEFKVETTNDQPLVTGGLLEITQHSAVPETEINVQLEEANNLAGLKLETFVNDREDGTVLKDGEELETPVIVLPLIASVRVDFEGLDPLPVSLDSYTTQFAVSDPASPPERFTLTVLKAGDGSGPVTSSPSGINCGDACTATFEEGTIVSLTATPNPGSTLSDWNGCDFETADECKLLMDSAKTVTVTFDRNTVRGIGLTGAVELLLE